jgi:hypothetical protein
MINFHPLVHLLKHKFEGLTPYERYKFFLSQYYLSRYDLGKENFLETDCSGILSGALYLAGFNIRCTAEYFFDHIYLEDCEPPFDFMHDVVCFVIRKKTDKVSHLLPHLENGVFLDAKAIVELCTEVEIANNYVNAVSDVVFRTTSINTLIAFSRSKIAATAIDPEISDLMEG